MESHQYLYKSWFFAKFIVKIVLRAQREQA